MPTNPQPISLGQVVRRAVKERDFFLSVATLEGRLDANASGRERSALAQAALRDVVARR